MLSIAELGEFVDTHLTRHAFRLELLDAYEVASDGGQFGRYIAGQPAPGPDVFGPWLERLRAELAAGVTRQRVHVVTRPLSPYLRYECEWGYTATAGAGEDIRILDLTGHALPAWIPPRDFWLIDDQYVVEMHYDQAAQFGGAVVLDQTHVPAHRAARDQLVAAAEPFGPWWAALPEEHRQCWRHSAA